MEREGGKKGNERRDNVEGEGGTSRAKSKFLFLSLSLSFFGSTFNLSDDNGVTGDIVNRRKTTGGRGTESLIKIH